MIFNLAVQLDSDATGTDLAAILVRAAPTIERCVGTDLADCVGTIRDLNGNKFGYWNCCEQEVPSSDTTHPTLRAINSDLFSGSRKVGNRVPGTIEPAITISNSEHLTVREINRLLDGSRVCYVYIEGERIRIRHARKVEGQLHSKSLFRPGEWITIPPDARVELLG